MFNLAKKNRLIKDENLVRSLHSRHFANFERQMLGFFKYFRQKFGKNNGVFDSKQS
jgi:hypothetical protein